MKYLNEFLYWYFHREFFNDMEIAILIFCIICFIIGLLVKGISGIKESFIIATEFFVAFNVIFNSAILVAMVFFKVY